MRCFGDTKRKILRFIQANPGCEIAAIRAALPEVAATSLQTALTQLRSHGYIAGPRNCYSIAESHKESAELLISVEGSPNRELIRRHILESDEPVETRDLVDEFALQPATVQMHLKALIEAGEIRRTRHKHSYLYSPVSDDVAAA